MFRAAAILATLSVPLGSAELRYLDNSGWVITTAAHVLVFDYVPGAEGTTPPAEALLTQADLEGRKVLVFVTHEHADHFSPAIFEPPLSVAKPSYVFGWPVYSPAAKSHRMGPRQELNVDGAIVQTIASTDAGVGFLVTVDGLTVFHAGDHARWSEELGPAFDAEIDWLEGTGRRIDVAFLPIATGGCEPRASLWKGARSAAEVLRPRVLFPMHVSCSDKLSLYRQFADESGELLPAIQVVAPDSRGQRFTYRQGKVEALVP